jgi:hypothetical protein
MLGAVKDMRQSSAWSRTDQVLESQDESRVHIRLVISSGQCDCLQRGRRQILEDQTEGCLATGQIELRVALAWQEQLLFPDRKGSVIPR